MIFHRPDPAAARVIEVATQAGQEVRRVRAEALTMFKGCLRAVYRSGMDDIQFPDSESLATLRTWRRP